MLLSKRERLAEATISLAEIKATKKLLSEAELSDENEEYKERIKIQLNKISGIYEKSLKPLLEKSNMRSFTTFVDNLISNSKESAYFLGGDLTDDEFQKEFVVLSSWYNLGTALAFFLKKIPGVVTNFKGFRAKSAAAGPKSDKQLIEIFDDAEIEGIKKRFIAAANEPIRITAIMTTSQMKKQSEEMRSVNAKFASSDLTISQYVAEVKKAMSATPRQGSDLTLTDPAEFNASKIAEELTTSSLVSINPMLGNRKVPEEKQSNQEIIDGFMSSPEVEGSIWKDADKYSEAMQALSKEIKTEIGEDLDVSDLKKFRAAVYQLVKDKKIDVPKLLEMINAVKKDLSL